LLNLLNLKSINESPHSEEWNTPMFHLLCLEKIVCDDPFQKVYCVAVLLLDKMFVEKKATYMEFGSVFEDMKKLFVEKLARRPTSVRSLANLVGINANKF
jgi:hypothetical protein